MAVDDMSKSDWPVDLWAWLTAQSSVAGPELRKKDSWTWARKQAGSSVLHGSCLQIPASVPVLASLDEG